MIWTFDALHAIAESQRAAVVKGTPPDTQVGAEAIIVAATLFDWIAANVPEEDRRVSAANKVALALNLETA